MSSRPFTPNTFSAEALGIAAFSLVGVAFGVLVLITPWAYGGVENSYRAGVSAVLAGLVVLALPAILLAEQGVRFRGLLTVMAPLLALLAVGGAQWAGGLFSVGAAEGWSARTLYPGATEMACAGLLAAIAAAFIGSTVFFRDELFTGLVVTCLVAAAAVGFFGIAMRLSGDDQIIRGLQVVGTPFARFVNRNNAAAFMLVGLACGIALLASLLRDRHVPGSAGSRLARYLGIDRQTLLVVVLVLTAIPLAGIVASASRGGTISAAVALLAGAGLLGRLGHWRRVALLVPALLLAGALLAWLGLSERTINRFDSLTWHDIFSSGRVPHWIDATNSMRARPAFGAGLGTYGYAYQAHSQRETIGWFQHADNEYVELAVETGTAGVLCLLGGLAIFAWAFWRGAQHPMERALIACLAAGQLAHAVFDYGIAIPATTLPAAALAAAATMRLLAADSFGIRPHRPWLARAGVAAVALPLAAGLAWNFQTQRGAAAVDEHRINPALAERAGGIAPEDLERRIVDLEAALEQRPQDAEGQRLLAALYVFRYRTSLAELLRTNSSLDEREAWRASGLVSLHRTVNRIADEEILPNLTRMREDELVQRHLDPALAHYEAAASACPWLTDIRVPLQALTFLNPELDLRDTRQVKIASELFPADPDLMRTMARMAWASHDQPLAGVCWRNAFAVSGEGFAAVLAMTGEELGANEAAKLIWPERTNAVGRLAVEAARLDDEGLRDAVGIRMAEMARSGRLGTGRRAGDAFGKWLTGNEQQATELVEGILAESPRNTNLRVDFAQLLWSSGETEMALEELRHAIWLDPDRPDARALMAKWTARERNERRGQTSERQR